MDVQYLIKRRILEKLAEDVLINIEEGVNVEDCSVIRGPLDTPEKIDEAMEALEESGHVDWYGEELRNFRENYSEETGLDCEWSRHYECKAVAVEIHGQWVGWTFWYGGGKHGEPGAVGWLENAYLLEMKEEIRPVKVFSRMESESDE